VPQREAAALTGRTLERRRVEAASGPSASCGSSNRVIVEATEIVEAIGVHQKREANVE